MRELSDENVVWNQKADFELNQIEPVNCDVAPDIVNNYFIKISTKLDSNLQISPLCKGLRSCYVFKLQHISYKNMCKFDIMENNFLLISCLIFVFCILPKFRLLFTFMSLTMN